jgi:CDP-diacylglycerol--glycerol-3-phosphate 3-phosphatidyltransferase
MTKLRLSWPNRITIGRILLTAPFVIVMLYINHPDFTPWMRYGALAIFAVMAVSDAVDGWLARRNHDVTRLGTFLDPLADKVLITCACLLLSSDRSAIPTLQLPIAVVVVIIGKDLYITAGFIILYMLIGHPKIVPMRVGKICTLLQLVMVIAMLFAPDIHPRLPQFRYFIESLWAASTVFAGLTVLVYTRAGARFLSEYEHRQRQKLHGPPIG